MFWWWLLLFRKLCMAPIVIFHSTSPCPRICLGISSHSLRCILNGVTKFSIFDVFSVILSFHLFLRYRYLERDRLGTFYILTCVGLPCFIPASPKRPLWSMRLALRKRRWARRVIHLANKCWGSGSGIRCLFDSSIWDPGWTFRIIFPRA